MCDILDMWYFYMQLQWMGPSKIKSFKNYAKFTTKIYTAYTVFQIFFLATPTGVRERRDVWWTNSLSKIYSTNWLIEFTKNLWSSSRWLSQFSCWQLSEYYHGMILIWSISEPQVLYGFKQRTSVWIIFTKLCANFCSFKATYLLCGNWMENNLIIVFHIRK